jgi:hypothetical protein
VTASVGSVDFAFLSRWIIVRKLAEYPRRDLVQ